MQKTLLHLLLALAGVSWSLAQNPSSSASVPPPNFQSIADSTGTMVRKNPADASRIVLDAIDQIVSNAELIDTLKQKAIGAIVGAAVSALPRDQGVEVLQTAVATQPRYAPAISRVCLSVFPTGVRNQTADLVPEPGMALGNIKVLKISGGRPEWIDASGAQAILKEGDFIRQGAEISTPANCSVTLLFENGTTILLEPETRFHIDRFLQSPFDAESFDYKKTHDEPSQSKTQVGVATGTMVFDISKLNKNSKFDIVTPLGVAGIRGTSGFVSSQPLNTKTPVYFGLKTGSVEFTAPSGKSQTVVSNQSIGVGGAVQGYGIVSNPEGGSGILNNSARKIDGIRSDIDAKPFSGAPARQPGGTTSVVPAETLKTLQDAAKESNEALVQTAVALAQQNPDQSVDITAVASAIAPQMAPILADKISTSFSAQAPGIAAAITAVVPAMANTVVIESARQSPTNLPAVASSVAAVVPNQAASIYITIQQIFPAEAARVGSVLSQVAPEQAAAIKAILQISQGDQGNPNSNTSGTGETINPPSSSTNPSTTSQPTPTPLPSPTKALDPVSPSA